jgi:hypothetical protein
VPAWLTTRTRNIDGRLGRDGFKIRISTYANDRQEIDFAPIAGNNISSFHVQGERRGNRLDFFDGALPLSYVTIPFLKRPHIVLPG